MFDFDEESVTNMLDLALLSVKASLTDRQHEFIQEFIYFSEWELALETLCTYLYEEDDIKIDKKSYELIEEIGNILKMDSKTWQILESRIINSDS
jgi:hypothetical protein